MPAKKPDAARLELQQKAVALRRDGHGYADIATTLKAPKTTVFRLVREALDAYQARTQADIAEHVALQLARLDAALIAISKRVEGGNLEAIGTMLSIERRRSQLLGLDMPAKIAPTDPSGKEEFGGGCGLAAMLAEAKRARGRA